MSGSYEPGFSELPADSITGDAAETLDWVAGLRRLALESERSEHSGEPLTLVVVEIRTRSGTKRSLVSDDSEAVSLAVAILHTRLGRRDALVKLDGSELLCVLPGTDPGLARERLGQAAAEYGEVVPGGVLSTGLAARRRGEDSARLLTRARADLRPAGPQLT